MFQVAIAAELLNVGVAAYIVGDSLFEPSSGIVYVTYRTIVQWTFSIDPVFFTPGECGPSYETTSTVQIATQPVVRYNKKIIFFWFLYYIFY